MVQPGSNQNGSSNNDHHNATKSMNQSKNSSHGYVNLPMPFIGEYQSKSVTNMYSCKVPP